MSGDFVTLWTGPSARILSRSRAEPVWDSALAVLAGRECLVTLSRPGWVRALDVSDGTALGPAFRHGLNNPCLAPVEGSPDLLCALIGATGGAGVIDLRTGLPTGPQPEVTGSVSAAAAVSDAAGPLLGILRPDGVITIHDLTTGGHPPRTLAKGSSERMSARVAVVMYVSGGRTFLTASRGDRKLVTWDARSGEQVAEWPVDSDVRHVNLDARGQSTITTVHADGTVHQWDPVQGLLTAPQIQGQPNSGAAVSGSVPAADGSRRSFHAWTFFEDLTVVFDDPDPGKSVLEFPDDLRRVHATSEGTLLVTGAHGTTALRIGGPAARETQEVDEAESDLEPGPSVADHESMLAAFGPGHVATVPPEALNTGICDTRARRILAEVGLPADWIISLDPGLPRTGPEPLPEFPREFFYLGSRYDDYLFLDGASGQVLAAGPDHEDGDPLEPVNANLEFTALFLVKLAHLDRFRVDQEWFTEAARSLRTELELLDPSAFFEDSTWDLALDAFINGPW